MDWLKALYELVGVPFPRLSLAVAALVGSLALSGAWWLVGRQYWRDAGSSSRGSASSAKDVSQAASTTQVPPADKGHDRPLTLEDLFESEFGNTLRVAARLKLTQASDHKEVWLPGKVYMDFGAGSKFSGFLIPRAESTVVLAQHIATTHEELVALIERGSVVSGGTVGQPQMTDSKDLRHSGRVVLYHEDHLKAGEVAKLEELYKTKGLSLVLRGPDYRSYQELARGKR